jgi:hypothetical protein
MPHNRAFMAFLHRHTGKLTAVELQSYVDSNPMTRVIIYLIGFVAFVFQIILTIILCNSNSGMQEDKTNRFLYISDKLASDQVIGFLLVFVFTITLLLLSVCIQDMCKNRPLYWITASLLSATAAMGVGVVGFNEHESDESFYGHVVCAGCFITGAISVHIIVLVTNTIRWTSQISYWFLISIAAACAIAFLSCFAWSFSLVHGRWRDEVSTIAASFELALLIIVLMLNLLTPLRVLEHMAHYAVNGGVCTQ